MKPTPSSRPAPIRPAPGTTGAGLRGRRGRARRPKPRARLLVLSLAFSIFAGSAPAIAQEAGGDDVTETSTQAIFDAEVAKYEDRERDQQKSSGEVADLGDMGMALLQMLLMLGLVCLLAYFLLGKALPRLMRVQQPTAPRQMLEVVDRLPLDQRRSIMVIKLGDRYFLVGATEAGISLLSRLESDEIEDALAAADARREATSLSRFAGNLLGRARRES
jgi:flagellar protein FliO/FliZ